MRFSPLWTVIAGVCLAMVAAAVHGAAPTTNPPKTAAKPGPCEQITQACKRAGFVLGDVKDGNGLVVDCIRPIMNRAAQPTKAKLALPQVSPDTVAACRAKRPEFGEPKPK